jgi:hypothetical protein
VAGSGIKFDDRGVRALKGVPGIDVGAEVSASEAVFDPNQSAALQTANDQLD